MPAVKSPRPEASLQVVVLVGTDHHPFDRLVQWVNDWLQIHPDWTDGFFVQSGTSGVMPKCSSAPVLGTDELRDLLDRAELVISHGGPATLADAWLRGQTPIVVPREPSLGEHVDSHQVEFCRICERTGRIRVARSFADFSSLLEEAAADLEGFRTLAYDATTEASVARFGYLVGELMAGPPRRRLQRGDKRRRRRALKPALADSGDRSSSIHYPLSIQPGRAGTRQAHDGEDAVVNTGVHRKEQA